MQANSKDRRATLPRTGHGAASVIPHLHDAIPLEPSQLGEPQEDPVHEEQPAADVRQESF